MEMDLEIHKLTETRLLAIEDKLNITIEELKDRLSTQEQMIATVATGYAELTVLVDALITALDHRGDEAEIEVFTQTIESKRREMLDVLSNFTGNETGSVESVSAE
jgi:DNA-binding ferritin-like protein